MADNCACEANGFSGSVGVKPVTARSGAGTLRGYNFFNANAAIVYVNLYDAKDDSKVTAGTALPLHSFGIPAGGGANMAVDALRDFSEGIVVNASTTRGGAAGPAVSVDVNLFF